jgi:hypothetical protein
MSLGDCLRSSIVEYTRECLALEAELFSSHRALTQQITFRSFCPVSPLGHLYRMEPPVVALPDID